jgi:monofunctional biosynthetic peptidoglycan transglycosylase
VIERGRHADLAGQRLFQPRAHPTAHASRAAVNDRDSSHVGTIPRGNVAIEFSTVDEGGYAERVEGSDDEAPERPPSQSTLLGFGAPPDAASDGDTRKRLPKAEVVDDVDVAGGGADRDRSEHAPDLIPHPGSGGAAVHDPTPSLEIVDDVVGPGGAARTPLTEARSVTDARPVADAKPTARPVEREPEPARPKPKRRWLRLVARIAEGGFMVFAFALLLLWCSVPSTSALAEHNPTSTAFIDLRRAQAEDAGKPFALEWTWRPIGKISRYLRAAIIYAEDYNFYRHDGVDWEAIEEALEANLDKGSFAIGGSTITQQLAKNLYLSPSRSMLRKVREMLIAFSLEDHLSKQRILELYLNVVEWGDGVFGAEAAARHWFGHSAQTLTPAEAVRLAIALPNPITRAPNIQSPDLTRKAVRIIRLLRMQGLIDEPQERVALDQVGARHEKTLPSRKRPEPGQPITQPDTGQPDIKQPDTGQPDTGQPDTHQPNSEAEQPVEVQAPDGPEPGR